MKGYIADKNVTAKWMSAPGKLSVKGLDEARADSTAQLLENMMVASGASMNEDFGTGIAAPLGANQGLPYGGFGKGVRPDFAMGVIRRTNPALIAHNLVAVEPIKTPYSAAFAMRYFYKTEDFKSQKEMIEASYKNIPEFSGFSGNTANKSGLPDQGTGVHMDVAEQWKINGDIKKNTKIPELTVAFCMRGVYAEERMLAASFSDNAIAHVRDMHNIDLLKDIMQQLIYESTAQLDRQTIAHCKALCTPKIFKRSEDVSKEVGADRWNGRWMIERVQGMVHKITSAANEIGVATRTNRSANVAIVSPEVASMLQQAPTLFNKVTVDVNPDAATPEIGTIAAGGIKVFKDCNAVDATGLTDNGEVLLAYKGRAVADAGVVYCPYRTNVMFEAVDPNDFSTRVAIKSEYAFADNMLGADNYYRLLKFEGIKSFATDTY